jgi:hypothetical protein
MKLSFFVLFFTAGIYFQSNAQAPKGFRQGQIMLEDSSVLSGYIKEYIRSYASLVFIPEQGGRKKSYDGSQIRAASIDSMHFICIRGDFFLVISEGRLCLLQKYSDASGKPSYNGTDPILVNGTDGQKNDYFIYSTNHHQLSLLTKKTYKKVIPEVFAGYPHEVDKTLATYDISQIRSAVNTINNN